MRVFAIGIECPRSVTVDRSQRSNTRELDGAALFGRVGQKLSRRQHGRHAVVG